MSATSRAAIENAITRRVGYEAATDADVPGREGSAPAQIITYDSASLGWRVVVAPVSATVANPKPNRTKTTNNRIPNFVRFCIF
jgi:hypothetical protein